MLRQNIKRPTKYQLNGEIGGREREQHRKKKINKTTSTQHTSEHNTAAKPYETFQFLDK